MRPRISISRFVCPSVRPSVRPYVRQNYRKWRKFAPYCHKWTSKSTSKLILSLSSSIVIVIVIHRHRHPLSSIVIHFHRHPSSSSSIVIFIIIYVIVVVMHSILIFLDASSHLYKPVCLSVRRSVGPSVRRSQLAKMKEICSLSP